jgi:4-carboxymuconolactone decarboxylase
MAQNKKRVRRQVSRPRASSRTKLKPALSAEKLLQNIVDDAKRIYKAVPHLKKLRDEVLFGDVWNRPELIPSVRSLVTCAVLASLGRNDELRVHVRRAVANGVTVDELRGLVVQVAFYAGWPAGMAIGRAALPYLS